MKFYQIYTFILILSSVSVHSLEIRFPDEELAAETVLPVFDPVRMVLNRNVTLKYRFEVGGGMTFGLDEPFRFEYYPTAFLSFHLSEIHGINLTGIWLPPLYSGSGDRLKKGVCDNDPRAKPEDCKEELKLFDVHRVPYPYIMGFLNYTYTPYYGKISLAKNFVMNMSLYGFIGPGLIVFNENTRTLAFNMGIGQRFYLSRYFALRTDVGLYGYYGPDPSKIRSFFVRAHPNEARQKIKEVPIIPFYQIRQEHKSLWLHLTVSLGAVILL